MFAASQHRRFARHHHSRRSQLILFAILLGILLAPFAQPVAANDNQVLYPTFGGGFGSEGSGIISINPDRYNRIALAPDGKIIIGGSGQGRFWFTRYLPDGSLDTSFADEGEQSIEVAVNAWLTGLAVRPDGRIVFGGADGHRILGYSDFILGQLHANGELDRSFGDDGLVFTNFSSVAIGDGTSVDVAVDLALQADGKIILGGETGQCDIFSCTATGLGAARYHADGSLDHSFGERGKNIALYDVGILHVPAARAHSMTALSDGGVIVSGTRLKDSYEFALAVYNSAGDLDSNFSSDGKFVDTNLGGPAEIIELTNGNLAVVTSNHWLVEIDRQGSLKTPWTRLSLQDGRLLAEQQLRAGGTNQQYILVAGRFNNQAAIARYTSDGRLDPAFGNAGTVLLPELGDIESIDLRDMIMTGDGKILLLTSRHLVQLRPDGSLDIGNGITTTDVAPGNDAIRDLARDSRRNIVAVGTATTFDNNGRRFSRMFTARYLPTGNLDPDFERTGILLDSSMVPSTGQAVAIAADNNIVSAGSICSQADCRKTNIFVRFSSFSGDSHRSRSLALSSGNDIAYAAEARGEKLLLAGQSNQQLVVLQLDPAGLQLDPNFASNGVYRLELEPGSIARADGIARQSDGKLVVAGTYYPEQSDDGHILVLRLLPDGQLDPDFADNGMFMVNYGDGEDTANTVLIQPDGKIVVAGTVTLDNLAQMALLRLDSQGRIDNSFNNGLARTRFDGPAYGYDAALLFDGGFTMVGDTVVDNQLRAAVARFTRNGATDLSFNGSGRAIIGFGSSDEQLFAIAANDNRAVVAGRATYQVDNAVSTLALLESSGRSHRLPVPEDDHYRTRAGQILEIAAPGILVNDSDPDNVRLSIEVPAPPEHGTLELQQNGSFRYTANSDYSGVDSFTYRINDDVRNSSTAIVTILVEPAAGNLLPIAQADHFFALADTPLFMPAPALLSNDEDPEGSPLQAELVNAPANGSLELAGDGSFNYRPNPGFVGEDRFSYRAIDLFDRSAPVEVLITVVPAGQSLPPKAFNDHFEAIAGQDLEIPAPGILANDTHLRRPTLSVRLIQSPAVGVLSLDENGALRYRAPAGYSGTVNFSYQAQAEGLASEPAIVSIQVHPGDGASAEPVYQIYLPLIQQ